MPSVLAISIAQPVGSTSDPNQLHRCERLVSRKVQLNQPISLGTSLHLDETVNILLTNQQLVTYVLRNNLATSTNNNGVPINLTTNSFRIQGKDYLLIRRLVQRNLIP